MAEVFGTKRAPRLASSLTQAGTVPAARLATQRTKTARKAYSSCSPRRHHERCRAQPPVRSRAAEFLPLGSASDAKVQRCRRHKRGVWGCLGARSAPFHGQRCVELDLAGGAASKRGRRYEATPICHGRFAWGILFQDGL